MIEKLKCIIKVILSYYWNGFKILRFSHFGKGSTILKGLIVNSPQSINIYNNVRIGRYARFSCYSSKSKKGRICIGDNSYICDYFSVLTADDVIIGNDTLFASFVTILGENHGINPDCDLKYGLQDLTGGKVVVKNNCWIGEKVIILPGVTIGDWSIIGAGSVVNKSIPPYSIAVGNPAKVIKRYNFESKKWERV